MYQFLPLVPTPPTTQAASRGLQEEGEGRGTRTIPRARQTMRPLRRDERQVLRLEQQRPLATAIQVLEQEVFTPFKKSRLAPHLRGDEGRASSSRGLDGARHSAPIASTPSIDPFGNHVSRFARAAPVQDVYGGGASLWSGYAIQMPPPDMSIARMHLNASHVDPFAHAPPTPNNHDHMLKDSQRARWRIKDYNGLPSPPTNMVSGSIYQFRQESVNIGGYMNNITNQLNNPHQLGNCGPM